MITSAIATRERAAYSRLSARGTGFPIPLDTYRLQPAIPSAGGTVTSPSPRRAVSRYGILDPSSIGVAQRLSLRDRLTLIRLALIRNPWSYGGRVSRPPYRYSYLHLLFQHLQTGSSPDLQRRWNAPLPIPYGIPRLRQAAYARLLSTPRRSTSELLRTL